MKAMILAAGRGERMRPLTDSCPKPLLKVAGIPLIEYHVRNLAKAGIRDIVINHAWLGDMIEKHLKDGSQFGVSISYSKEGEQALETAGGIIKAMPFLKDENNPKVPFLVVNGDVFTSFDFLNIGELAEDDLAKIWLVKNPEHNLSGDFQLVNNKVINLLGGSNDKSYTFTGIGLYRPDFFINNLNENILALGPILRESANNEQLAGDVIDCDWTDVGTPQRLAMLNEFVEVNKVNQ